MTTDLTDEQEKAVERAIRAILNRLDNMPLVVLLTEHPERRPK